MKFEWVEELSSKQIGDLHALYQEEWWTVGRGLKDVQRMVENSDLIVGVLDQSNNKLIGFTRVITDYVYKALILDVIVEKNYRGHDIGRKIMEKVLEHPLLERVKHFELYCLPEMVPFYQKWGFEAELGELKFMRKNNR